MAAKPVSSRPQTLRQARRAYQKVGATIRLSERQIRQMERSAELQERADRIKERETRRKANLKKKNERLVREREARARMGIPSPVKEDVGASQLRLGAFLVVGLDSRCEEKCGGQKPEIDEKLDKASAPPSAQDISPFRSPLQPRSGKEVKKILHQKTEHRVKPEKDSAAMLPPAPSIIKAENNGQRSMGPIATQPTNQPTRRSPSQPPVGLPPRLPLQPLKQNSMPPPPLPTAKQAAKTPLQRSNQHPMAPPPLPLAKTPTRPSFQSSKQHSMPPPPLPTTKPPTRPPLQRSTKVVPKAGPKPPPIIDEWAAFLVSNTQIERELSTPEAAPPAKTSITTTKPSTPSLFLSPDDSEPAYTPCPAPLSKSNAEDLLALICTQDLLGMEEVGPEPGGSRDDIGAEDPEFGNDISDGDLEGAVLQAERSAMPKEEEISPGTKQANNFYDDGFDISTQELRELVD